MTETRRLLAASAVGSLVEWYDFFVFASAAALVFDRAFFPRAAPLAGTLLAGWLVALAPFLPFAVAAAIGLPAALAATQLRQALRPAPLAS